MTIYIDIVILENVLINYIILELTGILLKKKRAFFRLLLSSILGAFFSAFSLISSLSVAENILLKLFISIFMVVIAFKENKKVNIIKNIVFFYLTTFVLGGISFMFIYFMRPYNIFISNGVLIGSYSLNKFFIGIFFAICFIRAISFLLKSRIEKNNLICDLEIVIKEKTARIKVLMDTGNLLKEPFTGKPVIIVEKNALKPVLEDDILENINEILKGNFVQNDFNTLFNIIPYNSLGNESGMLIGIRSDFVKIFWEEEVVIENAMIGIYEKNLSQYNNYSGLVGMEILNSSSRVKK